MAVLTDLQIAAALSEQAYRRAEQDQPLTDENIGVDNSDLGVLTRFVADEGFYYNFASGFVGRVVETATQVFVVFGGSDASGGAWDIANAAIGTAWANSSYADAHD
jgi:hypothetical protein